MRRRRNCAPSCMHPVLTTDSSLDRYITRNAFPVLCIHLLLSSSPYTTTSSIILSIDISFSFRKKRSRRVPESADWGHLFAMTAVMTPGFMNAGKRMRSSSDGIGSLRMKRQRSETWIKEKERFFRVLHERQQAIQEMEHRRLQYEQMRIYTFLLARLNAHIQRIHDASTSASFHIMEDDEKDSLFHEASSSDDAYMPIERPVHHKRVKRGSRPLDEQAVLIWREITKKEVPKVFKLVQQNGVTRMSNARKTAVLCSKEAKRWQFRTHKSIKDMQARARRAMREMLVFWKRNEREEREQRKRAEKEALERAKRAEEQRETMRQARKLNFLITQTELYSHFISRKIANHETSTMENDTSFAIHQDAPEPTTPLTTMPSLNTTVSPGYPLSIKDVDFDGVDDQSLQAMAIKNAQEAVALARDRAKQFNAAEPLNERDLSKNVFDGSEMNFMNPSSLGTITIQQPKMLQCQLKEYQLKGLNWLVNLYEQGINGILADEMGLGKTVQSIAVMAYLAENHNIWGPFFVIAPASTLHNWQQEITRFVPKFKVLPYWGNGKDRKVLRKFWNRKQLTYTEDAPFHVLVTSYQLVVQDAQYFQRIRWQYMILDEAQAIKSSNSSRWKNLLDMKCRNRLLLTGTPIQNTMQELWALLHFIMPSLFDSHDEFSEWFSKDIESHAQSNTSLNERMSASVTITTSSHDP
ncbi:hypothetical protein PCK1_001054 [Pneumocystis canis]|nr:hypothetical protein PCK1_001054 [Pneumocystis canis]